jgi:hypothetical protein
MVKRKFVCWELNKKSTIVKIRRFSGIVWKFKNFLGIDGVIKFEPAAVNRIRGRGEVSR